jgi:hypothetical protein
MTVASSRLQRSGAAARTNAEAAMRLPEGVRAEPPSSRANCAWTSAPRERELGRVGLRRRLGGARLDRARQRDDGERERVGADPHGSRVVAAAAHRNGFRLVRAFTV